MSLPKIDIKKLEDVFAEMDIAGVKYGLGAKAPHLDIDPGKIKKIDCSGFVRYAIYQATGGQLKIPDGSQNQRAWCDDQGLHRLAQYKDVLYVNEKRIFLAFIRPGHNGCGPVGHVWFITSLDGDNVPDTMESHGGVGVDSRPWNYPVLRKQVYSCYELPAQ